jgi:hypothetical protein
VIDTGSRHPGQLAALILIGCALLLPVRLLAGAKGDAAATKEQISALNFVKLLNAAEHAFLHAHGRYGTIEELVKSQPREQSSQGSPPDLLPLQGANPQADSEPIPGFHLRFIIAADASAYELSLTQWGVPCGLTLFSSESGVLYEGKTVECAAGMTRPLPATWAPPDVDETIPPTRSDVPCPLPQLLRETSRRVEELAANLQRFSAREQIEHMEVAKRGHLRTVTKRTFNYVAQINQEAGAPSVEEFRSGTEAEVTPETTVYDTGSAAFALIFHPSYIGDFAMTCEGLAQSGARPAWQVHFAQRPDRPNQFHVLHLDNSYFPLGLKGRAWIAADTYEVLRLETDLLEPIKKVHLEREHLAIEYGPVDFRKGSERLWLPQLADLYIDYHGHRYQRRHKFSDFELFLVESAQVVKGPKPPDSNPPKN